MNWTIEGKKTKFFSETVVWSNKPISRNFYIHIKRSAGLGHPLRKKSIILHLGEIWTNRFGGIKKNREEIVSVFNNNSNCATLLYYLRKPFERMNLMLFDFFAIWTTFTTNQIVGKRSPPMVKINKDFLFSSLFTWPRELYQNPSSRYILLPVLRTFRDAGITKKIVWFTCLTNR
jgi:hypothetical protein